MRKVIVAAVVASLSVVAQAQLTGGVTGAVGATTGAVGAGIGAGANAGVDTGAVGDTAGAVRGSAESTARSVDRSTRSTVGDAHDRYSNTATGRAPLVNAGAGVHVTRQTRCYDGTSYYDPYYGDGYYYCETSGPSTRVKVGNSRF